MSAYQYRLFTGGEILAARAHWKAVSAQLHFRGCQGCGRYRDDDGRPLLVARQERCRRFLCLQCWISRQRPGRRAA